MTRFVFAATMTLLFTRLTPVLGAPVSLTTTGQFQVQWKGSPDSAGKVYRSTGTPTVLLVTTTAFARPIFITIGPTTARLLDPARVTHDPATPEVVQVDPSGTIENLLGLKADGATLILDRDGISVSLVPTPPVLGDRTLDELLQALPDYRRDAAAYSPNPATVAKLQQLDQPAELVIFFGSWCSHCAQLLPRLVRVLQDAKNPSLQVRFHGIPPNGASDPAADAEKINALPTAILRRDGKELGRMIEDAWDAPETTLVGLLTGKKAP